MTPRFIADGENLGGLPVELFLLWKVHVRRLVLIVLDGCTLQTGFYEAGNASRCMHAEHLGSKGH